MTLATCRQDGPRELCLLRRTDQQHRQVSTTAVAVEHQPRRQQRVRRARLPGRERGEQRSVHDVPMSALSAPGAEYIVVLRSRSGARVRPGYYVDLAEFPDGLGGR